MDDEYGDLDDQIGPTDYYDAAGFTEDSTNSVEPVVSNDYMIEAANEGFVDFLDHGSVGEDLPPTDN